MKILLTAALLTFTRGQSQSLRARPIDVPESVDFPIPDNITSVIELQADETFDKIDFLLGEEISSMRQNEIDTGNVGHILRPERSPVYERMSYRRGKKGLGKGKGSLNCSGPKTPFASLVLVRFDGNPDGVSSADVRSLEGTFKKTYNSLISALCDDENRYVTGVTAVADEGSEVIRNGGFSYSILFSIELTCLGCDSAVATAFSPPSGRSESKDKDGSSRRLLADRSLFSSLPSVPFKTHSMLSDVTLEQAKYKSGIGSRDGKKGMEGGEGSQTDSETFPSVSLTTHVVLDEDVLKMKNKKSGKRGQGGENGGKGGKGGKGGEYKGSSSKGKGIEGIGGKGKGGKGGHMGNGGKGVKGKGLGGKKGNAGDQKNGKEGSGKKGKNDVDLCNCDSSEPYFRPPREREFQIAFNLNIQRKENRVVDVVELEEVSCASSVSEFRTYVAVEFKANAPPSIYEQEVLEQAFLETYNGIMDVRCDPFFRRVRTAILQIESLLEKGIQSYVVRYIISGTCRGCESTSNLFFIPSERDTVEGTHGRLLQSSADTPLTCTCPVFKTQNHPPTEDFFTSNYALAIKELRKVGVLPQGMSVREVTELEEVACPVLNAFDSVVVADHLVVDMRVPNDELLDLGEAFIIAYNRANSLNFNTCDLSFRTVTNVRALVNGPSNLNRPLPDGHIRITYEIDAICRGCDANTNLFDFSSSTKNDANTGRTLQALDDPCFCSVNSPVKRGPSSLEFLRRFDSVINEYVGADILTIVEDPQKVIEVDETECSATVNPLKSNVFVDFKAVTSRVTENDLTVIEQAFRDTYNDLIETFCDPIFRNILKTSVSKGEVRVSTSRVRYIFSIDGRCRECQEGMSIFHSAGDVSDAVSRNLAEGSLCFCTTGNPERRGPTVEEFGTKYDQRIRKLKKSGELKGIHSVVNVAEDGQQTGAPFPSGPVSPVTPVAPPIAPESPVSPVAPPFAPVSPVSPVTPPTSPVSPAAPVPNQESELPSFFPSDIPSFSPSTIFDSTDTPFVNPTTNPTVTQTFTPSISPSTIPSALLDQGPPALISPNFTPSQTPSAIPSDLPSAKVTSIGPQIS